MAEGDQTDTQSVMTDTVTQCVVQYLRGDGVQSSEGSLKGSSPTPLSPEANEVLDREAVESWE